MATIKRIGLDIGKNSFNLVGHDAYGIQLGWNPKSRLTTCQRIQMGPVPYKDRTIS